MKRKERDDGTTSVKNIPDTLALDPEAKNNPLARLVFLVPDYRLCSALPLDTIVHASLSVGLPAALGIALLRYRLYEGAAPQ